jgi:hypothetical protein
MITSVFIASKLFAGAYVDTPYRGNLSHNLNSKTPLNELILRFEGEWNLKSTGKAYWIGYTDDMCSIAAYKEQAIEPLLDFIKKTKSRRAQIGAIQTLHLIGIESKVAGRFYEKFKNVKARKALLSLLFKEDLRDPVMRLLIRDPWQSDVPVLMKVMEEFEDDCWTIVNGLFRYKLKDVPFRQPVPKSIAQMKVNFIMPENWTTDEFLWDILTAMKKVAGDSLILEKGLQQTSLWGYEKIGYGGGNAGPKEVSFVILLNDIVGADDIFSYTDLGNRIQYYVDGNQIYICSSQTAKKRWLAWWREQSFEFKEHFGKIPKHHNSPE